MKQNNLIQPILLCRHFILNIIVMNRGFLICHIILHDINHVLGIIHMYSDVT